MIVKKDVFAVLATLGLAVGFVVACGSKDDNDEEETSTGGDISFTDDVNPILTSSCGAAGCHGSTGAGSTVFVGRESAFKAAKTSVLAQLSSNGMPEGKGGSISAANEKILVDFLNQ